LTGVDPQILLALVLIAAGLVRGVAGFGDALVAMPFLAMLLGPREAVPLLTASGIVGALATGAMGFKSIDWWRAGLLLLAGVPGVGIGVWLLTCLPETLLIAVVGLVVVVFSGWSLFRPATARLQGRPWALPFGLLAGTLGGATSMSGPPLVIYGTACGWSPATFRASLQVFFLVTPLVALVAQARSGLWGPDMVSRLWLALPATALGLFIGELVHRRIPAHLFHRLVHGLLMVLGVMLLVQTARSLS
jgi:uncharacterized protein